MTNPSLPDALQHYIHTTMPLMDGWCSIPKATALAHAVLSTRPRIALEIGVFAGRSLLAIALAQRENANDAHLIGIDPWEPSASVQGFAVTDDNHKWWANVDHARVLQQCRLSIHTLDLQRHVHLMRTTSDVAIGILTAVEPLLDGPYLDLLHIDGNHSELQSVADVTAYLPLVRPGGTVIFDDTNWESTKKAQELLAASCNLSHFVEEDGQQCAFYTKKA